MSVLLHLNDFPLHSLRILLMVISLLCNKTRNRIERIERISLIQPTYSVQIHLPAYSVWISLSNNLSLFFLFFWKERKEKKIKEKRRKKKEEKKNFKPRTLSHSLLPLEHRGFEGGTYWPHAELQSSAIRPGTASSEVRKGREEASPESTGI